MTMTTSSSPSTTTTTALEEEALLIEEMNDEATTKSTSNHPASSSHRRRHRFHTNVALILTMVFVVALLVASMVFYDDQQESLHPQERHLDENDNNDNYNDYSSYSCNQIYDTTDNNDMDQRCAFAQTCNGGSGMFANFVFCHTSVMSATTWCWLLSPFLLLWMVLLFRMLGSTAEDYFSPSLEMFSFKLGLPPRFAGVSLLALGNGAADVSATINAIVSDPQNGYHISLGALTGAAMFVGAVVAGWVIVVSSSANKPITCRGALVRDVCALLVTVLVVSTVISTQNSIGPATITLFISMYLIFVVIVLIADIYHRAVVLPRLQQQQDLLERQRQEHEGQRAAEAASVAVNDLPILEMDSDSSRPASQPMVNRALNSVLGALSNYGADYQEQQQGRTNLPPPTNSAEDGWGIESDDVLNDRPIVLHGANGILDKHHHHHHHDEGGSPRPLNGLQAGQQHPSSPYTAMVDDGEDDVDGLDRICSEPGSYGAHNWIGAWHDAKQELKAHAMDVWDDIVSNEENNAVDKFLLICELPFVFCREVTVPIPCEGYYCRALVALAVLVSPLWLGLYLWQEHDVDLFWLHGVSYVGILLLVSIGIAALILRYAPGGEGEMALAVAAPIAFYGFIIAATWIDFIADHLVSLLDFLGIICRIPGSIMGLTILAWGNSMGDLSANLTMARKGLANMAMTACFAGPVFNILIGLGLGFSALSAQTGEAETEVHMSSSVVTGMIFIILNTVMILVTGVILNKGTIPKNYGYAAVALYVVYVVTCIVMHIRGK